MRNRASRIPPALKHGAYTATSVLPGESQSAFEKLHQDLVVEFSPSGALEDDIIETMAHLLWRKQNLMTLRIADRARARRFAILSEKVDRSEFKMPILGAEFIVEPDPVKVAEQTRVAMEQAHKELGDSFELTEMGEATTFNGLEKELAVIERLDSAIARCLKQFLMLRGIKSISAVPSSVSPKRIAGPSRAA